MIRIEVWSDINCPYCFIAKRNLERALEQLMIRNETEVIWRSFELDPDGETRIETDPQLEEMARQAGLDFHMDRVVSSNSFNAHRILQLARSKNLQLEDRVKERLFEAKYSLGLDINDTENLKELGGEAGLDQNEIEDVLKTDKFTQEVRMDEMRAGQLGITAVPFFIIEKEFALAGAHPVVTFVDVLTQVMDKQGGKYVNP